MIYHFALKKKPIWHWHKNRHIDQWNKIGSPEVSLHTYGQLIYNKGGKNIQWRKAVSLMSGAGKTEQLHAKE